MFNYKLLFQFIITILFSGMIGYIKGYNDCYIKNQIKAKNDLIIQQQIELKHRENIIIQERKAVSISNEQNQNYQNQLAQKEQQYNKLRKQWHANETSINNNNSINNEWVRFIQSRFTNPIAMPQVSDSSNRSNESATTYTPYRIGKYINEQFEACELNTIQLQSLQTWIILQESMANAA